MSRSYLDAPTLAALDMNLATQQVATSQRKIAEKRRLEIASLLDKLIQASITHGLSLADREALTSWEEEVLKKLDTPTESNYCCNLDYERISKTLHQMLKSKVKIASSGRILKPYNDVKNWLSLGTLIDSRDNAIEYDLDAMKLEITAQYKIIFDTDKFEEMFSGHVRKAIRSNTQNLVDDQCWYRILAVIEYVRFNANQEQYWKSTSRDQRLTKFLRDFSVDVVLEKMALHEASPRDSSMRVGMRRSATHGGLCCTVSSLSHGGRLGIRQIRMRGLTALREAADGGYHF